ncbi:MBL fold metallo-hydrolase [Mucilaginibacter boryungensis]|uniref:MBL fold metallo-hydrolase n=1 Tax=Mucilaginibacter boryungensis TaxID=768480 RepID=A0ABR9XN02_9SPHI|nr:MBL fold metallo-hydrolase [Mucilaginibacter boryungensis]MBE9668602.1 MBL fold metallo-hydrolase [Mucilaginibacter boryungensis]
MKITKYLHSCLVFEKNGFKLLVDPGTFSFAEGFIEADEFNDVDAVIITHIHADHLDKENLVKIIELSGAKVYTVKQVSDELQKIAVKSEPIPNTIGPFTLELIPVKHEGILDNPLPEMVAMVIDGQVLHPVDSFDDKLLAYAGIELLILPVMAPFTTELIVASFADKIRPKQVLPVHDGFAKPFFLKQRYENYNRHFEKLGVVFHNHMSEIGASVEV